MKVLSWMVGPLGTNCYLIYCGEGGEGAVIDPGFTRKFELDSIMREARRLQLRIRYIIDTHGHFDHVAGNKSLRSLTGAPILVHERDSEMLMGKGNIPYLQDHAFYSRPDVELKGGESLSIGVETLRVLHTPGHTEGSITLVGSGMAFTGDTLFAESIGRLDFPGSSPSEMAQTLKEKIMNLPDDTEIYPGHGPFTVMRVEKRRNPFLIRIRDRNLL